MGQGRDCVGVFGEARIWIHLPTWNARDRVEAAATAPDPEELFSKPLRLLRSAPKPRSSLLSSGGYLQLIR